MRNRRIGILSFVIVTASLGGGMATGAETPRFDDHRHQSRRQSVLFGGERSGKSDQRSRTDAVGGAALYWQQHFLAFVGQR